MIFISAHFGLTMTELACKVSKSIRYEERLYMHSLLKTNAQNTVRTAPPYMVAFFFSSAFNTLSLPTKLSGFPEDGP